MRRFFPDRERMICLDRRREESSMPFADIHIHMLYGVDDGAKTEADMWAMTVFTGYGPANAAR